MHALPPFKLEAKTLHENLAARCLLHFLFQKSPSTLAVFSFADWTGLCRGKEKLTYHDGTLHLSELIVPEPVFINEIGMTLPVQPSLSIQLMKLVTTMFLFLELVLGQNPFHTISRWQVSWYKFRCNEDIPCILN